MGRCREVDVTVNVGVAEGEQVLEVEWMPTKVEGNDLWGLFACLKAKCHQGPRVVAQTPGDRSG